MVALTCRQCAARQALLWEMMTCSATSQATRAATRAAVSHQPRTEGSAQRRRRTRGVRAREIGAAAGESGVGVEVESSDRGDLPEGRGEARHGHEYVPMAP